MKYGTGNSVPIRSLPLTKTKNPANRFYAVRRMRTSEILLFEHYFMSLPTS